MLLHFVLKQKMCGTFSIQPTNLGPAKFVLFVIIITNRNHSIYYRIVRAQIRVFLGDASYEIGVVKQCDF